ncbi:MAG: phosphatase PAP2 family protein [Candidatus Eisenbacteria bacterium]|uniref:Phosphatase PAP2 family protein n=1 Tax=Eiseniibacteriota bacterium TaxID=2212470 RepID=A0A956NB88_UNCEI|nr:phosphatase PAP2 family protein [Candidatus Eisenbacteria bacterium]
MSKRVLMLASLSSVLVFGTAEAADVVDGWTQTYVETVRSLIQTIGAPCRTSRSAAMMYLSMQDAVNSITHEYEPYVLEYSASPTASKEAAATTAAYEVMMGVYPTRAYLFDPRYEADLAAIPDGPEKEEGILVGQAVAAAMLELRSEDGSELVVEYEPILEPGHWRPTWPEYRPPKDPGYGRVRPFGLYCACQFPREEPPALDSVEYFENFEEVRIVGEQHADMESTLEYEIGWFWANDQDGTYKATGQMFLMAKAVADAADLQFEDRVHFFGLYSLAMADAAIAGWYAKYETDWDVWRPVTGIREADTDGNDLTIAQPDWIPISYVSPNFPGHVSGHAAFGGAAAQIFRRYLGTDEMDFVVPTSDPHLQINWTREMHSFTQVETEIGDSRIYIGVHWPFECDGGTVLGRQIGDWTIDNYLRPIDPLTASVETTTPVVRLEPIYPNPTHAGATLRFASATSGRLDIVIYDAAGRQVSLLGRSIQAGTAEISWDGNGADGRPVATGVYFIRPTLEGEPVELDGSGRLVVVR